MLSHSIRGRTINWIRLHTQHRLTDIGEWKF